MKTKSAGAQGAKGNKQSNAIRLQQTASTKASELAERFDVPKTLVVETAIQDLHERARDPAFRLTIPQKAS